MLSIEEIVNHFEPITLKEMDSVKLMDRIDTKFVFRIEKLPKLLLELEKDYKILDVEGNRISKYETLYFDTDDFKFYYEHQRGRGFRHKVRIRTYLSSNKHFFEIKLKNNKGRTIKDRIKLQSDEIEIKEEAILFLAQHKQLENIKLKAVIWVNYSRITLVHKTKAQRLTIDTNLLFKNESQEKLLFEIAIVELKKEKASGNELTQRLHSYKIYKSKFSKYCYGIIFLYNQVKHNNFKIKLQTLNKIIHESI